MNRILVVDDWKKIPHKESSNHVTYATTSAEALRLLNSQNFDEVWLDFDLGGDDNTKPVIEWLETHRPASIEIIRVISDNPPGMAEIRLALGRWWNVIG